MATSAAGLSDRSPSIGRVFSRAFATIGSNPVATLGIAFIFGAVPAVVLGYIVQAGRTDALSRTDAMALYGLTFVSMLLGIMFAMITQGALVRATIAHSEGRRAGFGESAMAGLVVVIPLFAMAVLAALGMGLGLLLFVVPGVILYLMWSVSAPALVEERLGPIEALGRSRQLTSGARWKIFGLELVLVIASWLSTAVLAAIGLASYGSVQELGAAAEGGFPLGLLVANAIVQTAISALWGVAHTSLYIELRDWKDGPPAEALAEVFG